MENNNFEERNQGNANAFRMLPFISVGVIIVATLFYIAVRLMH